MANAPITADFFQALDVRFHNVAQLAFYPVLLFDGLAQTVGVGRIQILGADIGIDGKLAEDSLARRTANAVNIRESDLHALVIRNVDAGDTNHTFTCSQITRIEFKFHEFIGVIRTAIRAIRVLLALSLFMLGNLAYHVERAFALHDLAMDADFFDGCSNFHICRYSQMSQIGTNFTNTFIGVIRPYLCNSCLYSYLFRRTIRPLERS